MREIPIKQARAILKQVLKGPLFTKKKDRSLTVAIQEGALTLIEQGYVKGTRTYRLDDSRAKHELTGAFKREFPRSHQLYMSQVKE